MEKRVERSDDSFLSPRKNRKPLRKYGHNGEKRGGAGDGGTSEKEDLLLSKSEKKPARDRKESEAQFTRIRISLTTKTVSGTWARGMHHLGGKYAV